MRSWQHREFVTTLFYSGKSKEELKFPENWEYDVLLCVWNSKETYLSKSEEGESDEPLCLSAKKVRELNWL